MILNVLSAQATAVPDALYAIECSYDVFPGGSITINFDNSEKMKEAGDRMVDAATASEPEFLVATTPHGDTSRDAESFGDANNGEDHMTALNCFDELLKIDQSDGSISKSESEASFHSQSEATAPVPDPDSSFEDAYGLTQELH